jgi:hypothetical protein
MGGGVLSARETAGAAVPSTAAIGGMLSAAPGLIAASAGSAARSRKPKK